MNDTLYIVGTGAVPAYSRDCLGNRPWHNSVVIAIVIYNGIVFVGAEAFSNIKTVRQVKIPYNSLDSMVPMMKQYSSYKFQLENYYMIGLAQNDTSGILKNLIPREAQGKSHNEKYPSYGLSSALTVMVRRQEVRL